MRRRLAFASRVALLASLALVSCVNVDEPEPELVVYLVRHAEKAIGPGPGLTDAGTARAAELAREMRDSDIEHVLSTDFRRTRATAQPTADALDLELELYDPVDLAGLAARLRQAGGRYLVVGHSNTTPELVGLLGGEPGDPIDEQTEYDRLYVISIRNEDRIDTELRRYGN